jgi:hypothetical protein
MHDLSDGPENFPSYLEDFGMTRLTLTLAACLGFVSVASASLTPRKDPPTFGRDVPQAQAAKLAALALEQATARGTRSEVPPAQAARLSALAREQAAAPEAPSEFVMTEQTEVLLNGKPCKYAEVPGHARIVRMELGADNKTVLKIHFRTGK